MIKNKKDGNAIVTKEMLDGAIGGLAIMIEKGFVATAKQADLLALTKRMDDDKLKTQRDIASIDFRVGKLEKKVELL